MNVFLCFCLLLFVSSVLSQSVIYSDWSDGRSSRSWNPMNQGSCNYRSIPNTTFPYHYIGAPNSDFYSDALACGQCYEITCIDEYIDANDTTSSSTPNTGCCNINETVTIQVTDSCKSEYYSDYCNNDMDHMLLSYDAYIQIADYSICDVINIQYRRVSCDFDSGKYSGITDTNIKIVNKDGISKWWYAIVIENIAGLGDLSKVELLDSSNNVGWYDGTFSSFNYWYFQAPSKSDAPDGWELPFSLRLTDTAGNIITSEDIITNYNEYATFDFASNFPISINYKLESFMKFEFRYDDGSSVISDDADSVIINGSSTGVGASGLSTGDSSSGSSSSGMLYDIEWDELSETLMDIIGYYLSNEYDSIVARDIGIIEKEYSKNSDLFHFINVTMNDKIDNENGTLVSGNSNNLYKTDVYINLTLVSNNKTTIDLFTKYMINTTDFEYDIIDEITNLLENVTSSIETQIKICNNDSSQVTSSTNSNANKQVCSTEYYDYYESILDLSIFNLVGYYVNMQLFNTTFSSDLSNTLDKYLDIEEIFDDNTEYDPYGWWYEIRVYVLILLCLCLFASPCLIRKVWRKKIAQEIADNQEKAKEKKENGNKKQDKDNKDKSKDKTSDSDEVESQSGTMKDGDDDDDTDTEAGAKKDKKNKERSDKNDKNDKNDKKQNGKTETDKNNKEQSSSSPKKGGKNSSSDDINIAIKLGSMDDSKDGKLKLTNVESNSTVTGSNNNNNNGSGGGSTMIIEPHKNNDQKERKDSKHLNMAPNMFGSSYEDAQRQHYERQYGGSDENIMAGSGGPSAAYDFNYEQVYKDDSGKRNGNNNNNRSRQGSSNHIPHTQSQSRQSQSQSQSQQQQQQRPYAGSAHVNGRVMPHGHSPHRQGSGIGGARNHGHGSGNGRNQVNGQNASGEQFKFPHPKKYAHQNNNNNNNNNNNQSGHNSNNTSSHNTPISPQQHQQRRRPSSRDRAGGDRNNNGYNSSGYASGYSSGYGSGKEQQQQGRDRKNSSRSRGRPSERQQQSQQSQQQHSGRSKDRNHNSSGDSNGSSGDRNNRSSSNHRSSSNRRQSQHQAKVQQHRDSHHNNNGRQGADSRASSKQSHHSKIINNHGHPQRDHSKDRQHHHSGNGHGSSHHNNNNNNGHRGSSGHGHGHGPPRGGQSHNSHNSHNSGGRSPQQRSSNNNNRGTGSGKGTPVQKPMAASPRHHNSGQGHGHRSSQHHSSGHGQGQGHGHGQERKDSQHISRSRERSHGGHSPRSRKQSQSQSQHRSSSHGRHKQNNDDAHGQTHVKMSKSGNYV